MNKKMFMAIGAALVIAVGVVSWLIFGGKAVRVNVGKDTTLQIAATLKNSVVSRESEGKKLWEFSVGETMADKNKNNLVLKDIKGKLYQKDGGVIEVSADKGTMVNTKNDFTFEGNVKASDSKGTVFTCDKINYKQEKDQNIITAIGNVVLIRGENKASADWASTTTELEVVKLKGNARVEKGGN